MEGTVGAAHLLKILANLRPHLPSRQRVQSSEPALKFRAAQPVLAQKRAEKILGRCFSLPRVAFHAARNEVAVRIWSQLHLRHHVVDTPRLHGRPVQTIKAPATLAPMDRFAQFFALQKIHFFQVDRSRQPGAFSVYRVSGSVSRDSSTGPSRAN